MGQLCYPGATQAMRTLQLSLSRAATAPIHQHPHFSPGLIDCSNEGSILITLLLMAEQTQTAFARGRQEVAHSSVFTWHAKKQA